MESSKIQLNDGEIKEGYPLDFDSELGVLFFLPPNKCGECPCLVFAREVRWVKCEYKEIKDTPFINIPDLNSLRKFNKIAQKFYKTPVI